MSDLLNKSFERGETSNFAAFGAIHNMNNELQDFIDYPKYKCHVKLKSSYEDKTNISLGFSLPKYTTPTNFLSVWLKVILPEQKTNKISDKIEYNRFATTLDLIKNITINYRDKVKKNLSNNEYKLELQSLGKEKLEYLNKKYFLLHEFEDKIARDYDLIKQIVIKKTCIYFPVFFNPSIKTHYVDDQFSISITFNKCAETLYTLNIDKSYKLSEIDLKEVKAIGIFEDFNDKEYLNKFININVLLNKRY